MLGPTIDFSVRPTLLTNTLTHIICFPDQLNGGSSHICALFLFTFDIDNRRVYLNYYDGNNSGMFSCPLSGVSS